MSIEELIKEILEEEPPRNRPPKPSALFQVFEEVNNESFTIVP